MDGDRANRGRMVFTRKPGQTIWVAGMVKIELVSCGTGKAKIAVTAPDDLPINRGEVQERVDRENAEGLEVASAS